MKIGQSYHIVELLEGVEVRTDDGEVLSDHKGIRIYVPVRELTKEEHDTLYRLYPNLTEQVYKLLAKEALLAVMK